MKLRADGAGYMWLVFVGGGLGVALAAALGKFDAWQGWVIAIGVALPFGLFVGWEFDRRRLELDEQRIAENGRAIAWRDVAYYTWAPVRVEEGELPLGKLTIYGRSGQRIRLHSDRWKYAGKALRLALEQLRANDAEERGDRVARTLQR